MTSGLLDGVRTGAWLDAQHFDPITYAVPGVIPEGLTLLVGAPKIGKSWFVLDLALAIAGGTDALGRLPVGPSRPTLYLALEDGDRRMQDRSRVITNGQPLPAAFHYMTRVEPGRVVETITEWLDDHPGQQPVVVLDTLGKVMPPSLMGESAYQRDYRVGSALKRVIDNHPGASLIVNHHDRKAASADFVDSVSGTHGLAGAADTIIHLHRDRNGTQGLLKVTGRDVTEAEYALTTGNGWKLAGRDLAESASLAAQAIAADGVGDKSAEILAFVRANGTARAGEVEAEFGPSSRQNLKRLFDSGRLDRTGRGVYRLTPSQPSHVTNSGLQLVTSDACDTPTGEEDS